MKSTHLLVGALVVLCSVHVASYAETSEDCIYTTETFSVSKGVVPACTPLCPTFKKKKVILTDPNEVWGRVQRSAEGFEKLPKYEGFDQCVAEVEEYDGRYTQEHLEAMAKGDLAATMPFEFALMILGPPSQSPTTMSMVNPLTGKADTSKTYIWMNLYGSRGTLRTVFSIIGTAALGVAGATSSLDTAVDALSVANVAATAELVTWQVSDISQAKVVTIQVDSEGKITFLMAQ